MAFILVLLTACMWCGNASAITVAVFPVDDLSMGHNSVNKEISQFLVDEISKKGVEIIEPQKIFEYMSQKNIKQVGHLETKDIMGARVALSADLVILASVCQKSLDPSALGVSIQLIRTSDGKTIWANTAAVSRGSEQRFLGTKTPKTIDDIKPIVASKLFSGWPADLDFTAGQELAGLQVAAVKETTYLEVDSVFFSPKVVRPGQEVKCTIRFKSTANQSSAAKVFIKVGNRVHLASSDDGVYYNAAWVGSGSKQGSSVEIAMNESSPTVLNEVWSGDVVDADYPVSLILDWPSGKRDESFLGSYVVDSRPPDVSMRVQGKVINGMVSFRDEIPITIHFKRSEPVKKWEFEVVDKNGDTVLRERGSSMPPDFKWRGQNGKNLRSDSGIYTISMKVWDRAGNVGVARENVRLLDLKPVVAINIEKSDNNTLYASLISNDNIPVMSWRMELWDHDNQLLKTFKGQTLPVKFSLPTFNDSVDKEKIACILKVDDLLGSKSFTKYKNIFSQVSDESDDDQGSLDSAIESDDWHADF
nr:hypothetical protein [Desulfobulbaceae bacterium]